MPFNENNCEITIVEILKEDKIDANDVFEVDDFFLKNDVKEIDKDKYIYLSDTSENIIKMKLSDIYENNLKIILQSGTPIINIDNYKLLGIYCGQNKSGNNISLFKKPITSYNKIIQKEKKEKNNSNEIYLILNVDLDNMWMKKYYFLCTTDLINGTINNKYLDIKNITLSKEINESTTKIYINGNKYKFKNYFETEKKGDYHIRIKFKSEITNFKYLFCGCQAIKSINFISMNTEKVTNMTGMFAYCSNLKDLNFQNFNTSNVTDMSNMFLNCSSLSTLCLNNFNTSKVTDMSNIFR